MKTVAQLKTAIRNDIWASGEPENLVTSHNNHFQEAFADIAKWVDGERSQNVNLVKFCKTHYKAGMTVLSAPKGKIIRLFTVANEEYSDPVFYRQVAWPGPEQWARNLFLYPLPLITAVPKLPLGFQYADAANDSLYGRARTGVWAVYRQNIYIAPWIQSNELVVVEWDGIKEQWDDADLINPAIAYQKAVKLYVQFAHERDYGKPERAVMFHNERDFHGYYDTALGDLIHEDREQTKTRRMENAETTAHERDRLCSELSDDANIITDPDITLADVGNVSAPGSDLDQVSALVKSLSPAGILACGFIATGGNQDYDETAGDQFSQYIKPYAGNKGPGGDTNGFWPVPAADDWTLDSLATFDAYFGTKGNGRYYDVVIGDVHIFVVDSSSSDPDGITSGGTQGAWLQARLALSTAAWKIVKMDQCAWGSVHNNATLQWPFASWGAHLLITSQAKNYERLSISDFPVINNGLGGLGAIEVITAPTADTIATYAAGFGAGRIRANSTELIYEFLDVNSRVIDTLVLDK